MAGTDWTKTPPPADLTTLDDEDLRALKEHQERKIEALPDRIVADKARLVAQIRRWQKLIDAAQAELDAL